MGVLHSREGVYKAVYLDNGDTTDRLWGWDCDILPV
jgi:hypothetical protein